MKSVPLSVANPHIASEATTWDPTRVSSLSERIMNWQCAEGHLFDAQVAKRVRKNLGCPYCTNRWLDRGINDLTITHPELAKEADGWDPSYQVAESVQMRSWKCDKGHAFKRQILARTRQGLGCPKCSTQQTAPKD